MRWSVKLQTIVWDQPTNQPTECVSEIVIIPILIAIPMIHIFAKIIVIKGTTELQINISNVQNINVKFIFSEIPD